MLALRSGGQRPGSARTLRAMAWRGWGVLPGIAGQPHHDERALKGDGAAPLSGFWLPANETTR